jgi:cytidylate kinase
MNRLIVTLDGPAGSGKSTIARQLADRLGVAFLDTGAMYRAIAALAVMRGINPEEEGYAVVELARNRPVRFDWAGNPPRVLVGETEVTDRLRDSDVTDAASDIAAMNAVRQVLVEAQRRIGREQPRLVTEGRDQGSVVFPDADVKFYLEARAGVRAQRRADQLRAAGRPADYEAIRQQIIDRDYRDENREDAPLHCPPDAERIDTSDMTLDEVVDLLHRRVQEKVPVSENT